LDGAKEFSTSEALKYYGISMQGLYGDNKKPQPSILNIVERMKWSAWESDKGMDRVKARKEFVEHSKIALQERGFTWEHPDKARINAEYMSCVAKKLASGKTKEEIAEESHAFEKQEALAKKAEKEAIPVNLDDQGLEYSADFLQKNWNL